MIEYGRIELIKESAFIDGYFFTVALQKLGLPAQTKAEKQLPYEPTLPILDSLNNRNYKVVVEGESVLDERTWLIFYDEITYTEFMLIV